MLQLYIHEVHTSNTLSDPTKEFHDDDDDDCMDDIVDVESYDDDIDDIDELRDIPNTFMTNTIQIQRHTQIQPLYKCQYQMK